MSYVVIHSPKGAGFMDYDTALNQVKSLSCAKQWPEGEQINYVLSVIDSMIAMGTLPANTLQEMVGILGYMD